MTRFSTCFFTLLCFLATSTGRAIAASGYALPTDTVAPDTLPFAVHAAPDAVTPPLSAVPNDSTTAAIVGRLRRLTESAIFERTQLGLYVYDLTADAPVFALGEHQQLRPASCQKIITAVAALTLLGTDYNYRTTVYTDGTLRDSTLAGHLYLKGGFDPLLDDADLKALADSVLRLGIRRIEGGIRFDRSLKDTTALGWGWCWDDEATPLTPLLCNGSDGLERRFVDILRQAGISCTDATVYDEVPRRAQPVGTRTHTIDQVLLPMMKQSDNLFAETLFYHIGAQAHRAYADRKRAARSIAQFLADIDGSDDTYQVADGSGLSLYNYATPHLLVCVLRHAYRNAPIYRHLLPALPIAGEDGTLRRRMTAAGVRGKVMAKTGTVEGVSTLAGYCQAANGHLLCFAIMNQGIRHTATGHNFQDRVCKAMVEE